MGPEQDSSVGTWEQSPIHEVGQTKSAFPPLRHSPENHWQAKHAGKDYVTSKVKRKKAECQAGSDYVAWGCLTALSRLTLLVSKQSGAVPFAEGRHSAGS